MGARRAGSNASNTLLLTKYLSHKSDTGAKFVVVNIAIVPSRRVYNKDPAPALCRCNMFLAAGYCVTSVVP